MDTHLESKQHVEHECTPLYFDYRFVKSKVRSPNLQAKRRRH
jgi:hypothetical protein